MKFDVKRHSNVFSQCKADLCQKLRNKRFNRNLITLFIGFLSFSLIFHSIFVISPSKGSDMNDIIPTLEYDVSTRGVLSIEEMRKGEVIVYYYVNIDQIDIYELRLTLPPEVNDVRVEFRYLKENEFNNKELEYIDNLYFDEIGEYPTTISRHIPLLKDEYIGTIGLTFVFHTVQDPDRDESYYIIFSKTLTKTRDQLHTVLTPEVSEYSEIFILDLLNLGVTTEGFYSLSMTLSVIVTLSNDSFYGNSQIRCLNEGIDIDNWDSWGSNFTQENTFFLYIDPNQEYFFQTNKHLSPYNNEIIEMAINIEFELRALIPQTLSINELTIIQADGPALVHIDIPEENSVKITFQHSPSTFFRLEVRNKLSRFRSWQSDYESQDDPDYFRYRSRKILGIQLVRRDIDPMLISSSDFPEETTQIAFGGFVEEYRYERATLSNTRYTKNIETSLLNIPLVGNDDSVYFLIESDDSLSIQSVAMALESGLSDDLTINSTKAPLRMFEINAQIDDLFIFEKNQEFHYEEPPIAYAADLDSTSYYSDTFVYTNVFLPGNPSFLSGSHEDYFQLSSMKRSPGVLIYLTGYYLSCYGYLTSDRPQRITDNEMRVSSIIATVEPNFTKTKIPKVGNMININTSGIHWFLFPVEEDKIYKISIESHPFGTNVNAKIIDIYGNNPLIGQNDYIRMSDSNNVFIGKRTIKGYLILEGDGLVRITIEKNSSLDQGWILPPTTIFGILLFLGIAAVLIGKRFFPT